MKWISACCLTMFFAVTLLASCSALHTGSPIKAGFDAGKSALDADEESWASRHIPGLKTLSNLVPPPSEARTKWDEWQKKRQQPWNMENNF